MNTFTDDLVIELNFKHRKTLKKEIFLLDLRETGKSMQPLIMKYSHKQLILTFLVIFSLLFLNISAFSQEIEMTLGEIYQKSDIILHATVETNESAWVFNSSGRNIVTTTKFRITESIKGGISINDTFDLEMPGGTIGDTTQYVSTSVLFSPGEESILFLQINPLRVMGGFQGKFPVIDGMVYIEGQRVKPSQFVNVLKEAATDEQAITQYLKQLHKESFSTTGIRLSDNRKSGMVVTTGTYAVDGKISDFSGGTDANADGYFESFTFNLAINGNVDLGPDTVYFKIICTTTGQSWFSNDKFAITDNTTEYFNFGFDESVFAGYFTGNTALDFSVEMWDTLKINVLASDITIENEPVLIGIPIPPAVTISSITPDKASAGTNSNVTITGNNFGATQGTGKVNFFYRTGYPKITATIVSWSNTQIVCSVPASIINGYPASAGSGPVTVTNNSGQISNGYPFRITFGYGGYRWPGTTFSYMVNENFPSLTGEGQAVQNAANSWNSANSNFRFEYAGSHTNTTATKNGINEILWAPIYSSALAETTIWLSEGYIIECDIVINESSNWTTTPGVPPLSMDIESNAVHELGHCLNLRDIYGTLNSEYDQGKIMFGFSYQDQSKRNLHADDIEGINWIYGHLSSFSISGYVKTSQQVAIPNVEMTGLPGNPLTNASGYYTAIVQSGWAGTVTPVKPGFTFTPPNRIYTNVLSILTNQNFSASGLNADATLSDLKVNGSTVAGFLPALLNYTVQLPFGTTVVPTVTAITTDSHATKTITPAATLPGITNVEVTAENGTTKKNYTITFTLAPASTDASLSDLKVSNHTITGFNPETLNYTVTMPYGSTLVPTVTATTNFAGATHVINPATSLPGITTVRVTAQDGITQKNYTINFQIAKNDDASLSALYIDGMPVADFMKSTLVYNVELPFGTIVVPVVTATTSDPNASKMITPAISLPGNTTIQVTAENGVATQIYTVAFTVSAPSSDANLSDLKVNGTTLPEFYPGLSYYDFQLPYGTLAVPAVTATASHALATVMIYPAPSLPGVTNVVVTAQDGTTKKTYSINFILAKNTDATLSDIRVSGASVPGFEKNTLHYTVELPFGTSVVPVVTAIATDPDATIVISPTTDLPGSTAIAVTAEDNITKKTYSVHFTIAEASADANLSDLKIGGVTVTGFSPSTTTYFVELPFGSTIVPVVTASASYPGATIVITSASSLPGTTLVLVTAQDGSTKKGYRVNFTVAKSNNANLSALKVSGTDLPGFDPGLRFYQYAVSAGTEEIPEVTALADEENATVTIQQAAAIPDTAKVLVIAEDGIAFKTYEVLIRYPFSGVGSVTDGRPLKVFPNPTRGLLNLVRESAMSHPCVITVTDLTGRILMERQMAAATAGDVVVIDLSGLDSGIYLLRVIDLSGSVCIRVVKE
jgi:hypothetical protein